MAKFDWDKARSSRQSWAYTAAPALRQRTPVEWRLAEMTRNLAHMDERIANGRSWLATIATTDRRYPKWACKLATLRLLRVRLQRQIEALKIAQ